MSLDGLSKFVETDGGKVCVIVFMLVFVVSVVLTMTLTAHPLQEAGKEMTVGAITSLLTLLYQKLK